MKRICVIERDNCGREVYRHYMWFDPTDHEEDEHDILFTEWLRDRLYNLQWSYEADNCQLDNFKLNKFEAWIEDVNLKGCIESNFQLF